MFECGTCDRVFPAGRRARDQHCEATGHSSDDDSGYRYSQRYGGWLCSWCDDVYLSEEGCREHMVEDHLYCSDCERSFMNYNNIKQVRSLRRIETASVFHTVEVGMLTLRALAAPELPRPPRQHN